jgi:hypothetical protein
MELEVETRTGAAHRSRDPERLTNTSKMRTHSLFRQGCMLYDLIPNMPDHRLSPLIQKFTDAVSNAELFTPGFALVKRGDG